MNLKNFYGKIGQNYAWEFEMFHKYRDLSDGLDIANFEINWNRYMADHNPQFIIVLKLFNVIIFEFIIHNIWHTDNPNSPFYGKDDN